ncbi:hypothetical protein J6590_046494, partial [Homalodisca vitripennis]
PSKVMGDKEPVQTLGYRNGYRHQCGSTSPSKVMGEKPGLEWLRHARLNVGVQKRAMGGEKNRVFSTLLRDRSEILHEASFPY